MSSCNFLRSWRLEGRSQPEGLVLLKIAVPVSLEPIEWWMIKRRHGVEFWNWKNDRCNKDLFWHRKVVSTAPEFSPGTPNKGHIQQLKSSWRPRFGPIPCWMVYPLTPEISSGWWLTYPSEKYKFVSWDDDIPNWLESHKIHVPNHQPDDKEKNTQVL